MLIQRVQVEEGFLDGLDLEFSAGLNVVIGARGTGKTSLIELIRHCFGVRGLTLESDKNSREHALSVLGSGQVTVTVNVDGHEVIVSRSADEETPRASGSMPFPIIFSQKEIESVGLSPKGRMQLIDGFVAQRAGFAQSEAGVSSEIASLSSEISNYRQRKAELEDQLKSLPDLARRIQEIEEREKGVTEANTAVASKKAKLDELSKAMTKVAVAESYQSRFLQALQRWRDSIKTSLQSAPDVEPSPTDDAGEEERKRFFSAREHLVAAIRDLDLAEGTLTKKIGLANAGRIRMESEARQLRKEIESLQQGAGAIVKEGAALRQSKAQLESLQKTLDANNKKLGDLLRSRSDALNRLDTIREHRFAARKEVADSLNGGLGPRIRVEVENSGQVDHYAAAISNALRGTGLKYNDLAPMLAEQLSPRELAEAAEGNDFELIVRTLGISRDRALRVISELRDANLGELLTARVDDDVRLQLLDGTEYKEISELSTGQRCTVVLPIVLEYRNRVVIVDQPEDHIDNAFIVDTIVKALRRRADDSQMIFSTHNANIPVLGAANRVIQLGSDGQRGFVLVNANLDDRKSVAAITSVMEGGRDAFKKRATFYSKHKA